MGRYEHQTQASDYLWERRIGKEWYKMALTIL